MRIRTGLTVLALAQFMLPVTAQTYPAKAVRVVNPYAAGGGLDAIFRPVMSRVTENVGQSFVIDNRAGANGQIGSEIVAKSALDGYTLLTGTTGALSINAAVFPKLPYDPVRDFTPICNVVETSFLLLTHPSLNMANAKALAVIAKTRPGQLSYASFGPANVPQAIVMRLHAEIVKAVNTPEVRERLENVGVDIIATSPQEFAAQIKSDLDRWTKVVKQAGIRVD